MPVEVSKALFASTPSHTEVWPEHVPALATLSAMATQWRMGPSGPIGMDYNALPFVFRQIGVMPDDEARVFADLQVIELEYLSLLTERRKQSHGNRNPHH